MAEFEISFDPKHLTKLLVLGLLLVVLWLELNVTLNTPIAFGDEGFHVAVARYMGTEVDYPVMNPLQGTDLYPERFNRPPLWNMIEGSFYFLFGFSDVIVKFLMPFVSFMTGMVVYVFLRRLYSELVGVIGAILSVTIPSFVTYSVFFYTTVPYVFLFSIGFLSLLTAIKEGGRKYWVLAGIFSGLAILANIAGLFLAILAVAMGLYHLAKTRNLQGFKEALKTYGVASVIMLLIISPWIARNVSLFYVPGCTNMQSIITGSCTTPDDYTKQTSNDFVGRTAGGGTEGSIIQTGIPNYLRFAYGFVLPGGFGNLLGIAFIPFSFLAGLVIVAKKRETIDVAIIASVIIFLLLFFQFGGFFEGRAEDTSRYFLSAVPLIGLVAALYWSSIRKEGSKFNVPIIALVLVVVLAVSFFSFLQKVTDLPRFKSFIPSFFEACDWIKDNTPKDSNLFSLNTHPTRYNCDRPAVWETPDKADILLSNDPDLVVERLKANGIDYVFVQKFALSNQALGQSYPVSFVDLLESSNTSFQKVYENGPVYGTQEFSTCVSSGTCDPGNAVYRVT